MEDNLSFDKEAKKLNRIEDNITYQKYANKLVRDVPVEDMDVLLMLFLCKAAVNMGRDAYDAPDAIKDSILEFIYREFDSLPVCYIGYAIIKGSLGKYGATSRNTISRLIPANIYKWLTEVTQEYERKKKHEKLSQPDNSIVMNLHKYPAGKAIAKKIQWFSISGICDMKDWDQVPLMDLAARIGRGEDVYPETYNIKRIKQ